MARKFGPPRRPDSLHDWFGDGFDGTRIEYSKRGERQEWILREFVLDDWDLVFGAVGGDMLDLSVTVIDTDFFIFVNKVADVGAMFIFVIIVAQ